MQNEMRDRLVPIVKDSLMKHIGKSCNLAENIVDDLIENGVIIPPCKVHDTVYYLNTMYHMALKKNKVYEAKVVRIVTTYLGTCLVIHIRSDDGGCCEIPDIKDWGKTIFLKKEEAEKAKEGADNGI